MMALSPSPIPQKSLKRSVNWCISSRYRSPANSTKSDSSTAYKNTGDAGCTAKPARSHDNQKRSMAAPPRTYHMASALGTVTMASAELVMMDARMRMPSACPARQSARCPMTSGRANNSIAA